MLVDNATQLLPPASPFPFLQQGVAEEHHSARDPGQEPTLRHCPACAHAGEDAQLSPGTEGLGPARVVSRERHGLRVELEDGRLALAELALAFPYAPSEGDRVLVIGQAGRHYVIGVLETQAGLGTLRLPGDLELHAAGTLRLAAGEVLELEAAEVSLRARLLRVLADEVSEKVNYAYRWVKGQLVVRAGSSRRVILGEDHTQAQSSTTLAQGVVKVDGSQLQLGH